jgi:hypothetical protein
MTEPQLLKKLGGRSFLLLHLERASDWPDRLPLPTRYVVVFFGMDASKVATDDLAQLAEATLDAGAVYVCAWGPDCGRVHDIFDDVIVSQELESGADDTIITTWHAKEALEEALWYFAQTAIPDDAFENECGSWLAVSVGAYPGADEIRRLLDKVTRADDVRALRKRAP